MARPPITMTPEALAELERQIGPRGSTQAQVATRAYFRRWLTGNGVASAVATVLTLSQLSEAYNDTTGTALEQLCKLPVGGEPTPETPETEAPPPPAPLRLDLPPVKPPVRAQEFPEAPKPAPAPLAAPPVAGDAATQLAALIAQLATPQAAPLDEARVMEIARKAAEEAIAGAPPRKVEIKIGEQEPITFEHAHEALPDVLMWLAADVHVYLCGPAGSGKTTLAEQAAQALQRKFYHTGALDSRYALEGFRDAQGNVHRTPFREAFEHGGLFLFDEMDASDPTAPLAFNQALSNGAHAFPDGIVARHPQFIAIAAANTWGSGRDRQYVGRNQLDAATLDRFASVAIDYDESLERRLATNGDWCAYVQKARASARRLNIRHVISPRATLQGCKALAAGAKREQVEKAVLWRGLDADTVTKIKAGM